MEENLGAAQVQLSQEDLRELEEAFPHQQVGGWGGAGGLVAPAVVGGRQGRLATGEVYLRVSGEQGLAAERPCPSRIRRVV